VTLVLGACAVVAAVVALVARRLEHMAVAIGVVGGVLAVDLIIRGLPAAALALTAGSALLVLVVLVALALVEVDARPVRRLQPWKLLLLVPLVAIAPQVAGHAGGVQVAGDPVRASTGAIIVVGLLALAAPLLLRRRQGGGR
jgi:MYXO-CTERM domain-containing protein